MKGAITLIGILAGGAFLAARTTAGLPDQIISQEEVLELNEWLQENPTGSLKAFLCSYLSCDALAMEQKINLFFQSENFYGNPTQGQSDAIAELKSAQTDLLTAHKEAIALSGKTDIGKDEVEAVQDRIEDAEQRAASAMREFKKFR